MLLPRSAVSIRISTRAERNGLHLRGTRTFAAVVQGPTDLFFLYAGKAELPEEICLVATACQLHASRKQCGKAQASVWRSPCVRPSGGPLIQVAPIGELDMHTDTRIERLESSIRFLDKAFAVTPIEASLDDDKTPSILPVVIHRRIGIGCKPMLYMAFPTSRNCCPPTLG